MTLYLGMGWIGLTLIRPLALAIPLSALLCLIAGGIAYTAGTLFSRTTGCVMAISSGISSCLPALAVTLQPCLFVQSEKRRVELDKRARAAD